jgi:putative endonuclease
VGTVRKTAAYYVYIILCEDGTYYTGYSNDPAHRLAEHLKGRGAKYTRMHKPKQIVYLQRHKTQRSAMIRERRIKTLTHDAKRRLIEVAT